jgi:hypothetical protein
MPFRWPTDPPGKAPAHTKSWEAHQASLKGTPAAPAAPTPGQAPLPVDATFDAQIGGLENRRDSTLAGLTGGRTRGLAEYGFTESAFDPATQEMGALAFDPNNPFSKAALLKKTFDTAHRSAGQSMGAQGQLYAGAYQNQQDLLGRNQLQGEDSLQKSLAAFLSGNSGQRTQAQTDFELDSGQAFGDRVSRANTNPLYSPTTPEIPAAPAAPGAAAPKAKAKAKAKGLTIKAGPNVKATKNTTVSKKRKGKTVTYTTSVKGP